MVTRNSILFLVLAIFCDKSESVYPAVTCPNIFRYVKVQNTDMGLITLQNVNYGETILEVELSQPGALYGENHGYLDFNIDENKYSEYIQTGTPITYKVNFPLNNVVPQITSIRVNGQTLCSGPQVSPPSTTITLKHSMMAPRPISFPHQVFNFQGSLPMSQPITAQNQLRYPNVPCADIFRYDRIDGNDVGVITIENLSYGITTLEIELSQSGSLFSETRGNLNLDINENEVNDYIKNRRPVTYTLNFPNGNVLPQVNSILRNGKLICSGPRAASPSTTMTFRHTLTATAPFNTASEGHRSMPQTGLSWERSNIDSMPSVQNPASWSSRRRQMEEEFNDRIAKELASRNSAARSFFATTPPTTTISNLPRIHMQLPTTRPISTTTTTRRPQITITSTTRRVPTTTSTTRLSPTTKPTRATITTTTAKPENNVTFEYINSICGQENTNFAVKTLSIKGQAIPRARFPWIVALYKKNISNLDFQCGGSLISTQTVISAAHCFYDDYTPINEENIMVSMGRHNLIDWSDSYVTNRDVKKIIRHPDYRPELINIDADLAIVLFKTPVTFCHSVRPVCLWRGPLNVRDIEGVSGIVVGWGRDENNSNITSLPRLVRANVASELTCIRSNSQMYYLTSNRTLCAGDRDGTGPCNGDSGSGLMIKNRSKWMMRGTVSAALGTAVNQCNLEEYVVYTDIAMFITWIHENMKL